MVAFGTTYDFNVEVVDSNHLTGFSSPLFFNGSIYFDLIMTGRSANDCLVVSIVLDHIALLRVHMTKHHHQTPTSILQNLSLECLICCWKLNMIATKAQKQT